MKAPAEAVLDYLRAHPNARRGEVRAGTGLTEAAVGDALERLCDAGLLVALRDPAQPNWYRYGVPSAALAHALDRRDQEVERLRQELAAARSDSPAAATAARLEVLAERLERALRPREAPALPRPSVSAALACPPDVEALAKAIARRHGIDSTDPAWVLATVSNRLLAAERGRECAA